LASGNYRADHVGSLMPALRRDGGPDPDSVIGAIELQRDATMDVFTDGEPWRSGERGVEDGDRGAYERLRSLAPSWARLKMTLVLDGDHDALAGRANQLLAAGLDYLQLDARGRYSAGATERLASDHQMLASLVVPEGATTGIYLGDAPLDEDILEAIFALPVERFLIGVAAPGGRDVAFARHLPEERFLVLGLIDAGSPELEDPDDVLAVMDAAGELHGDRLAVSPSRGFADVPAPAGMTLALQRRKLELVSDVARMIWGTEL
jgi:methionine synthase II (cobalamin-independent)